MVVLSEGGITPLLPVAELDEMGYKLIGYSGLAIGAAARGIQLGLRTLKGEGTTIGWAGGIMSLAERNRLLDETTESEDDETGSQKAAESNL